jgi:hypothetical protein
MPHPPAVTANPHQPLTTFPLSGWVRALNGPPAPPATCDFGRDPSRIARTRGIRLAAKPETIATMRLVVRILIVIILPLLALTGCGKNYDWNQKLTVKVETPDGEKSASSVMSAQLTDTHGPFVPAEANGVSFQLSGEAVVLEVSPGRYLFVLLKDIPALNWLVYPKMDSTKAGALLESGDDGGAGEVALQRDQYPLLVTFDDINNPASVKRVNPANLEATFGPGYRLNGITLALTKEPVTKGEVEKVLGWLAVIGRERPTLIPNPPRLQKDAKDPEIQFLTVGGFSSELYK